MGLKNFKIWGIFMVAIIIVAFMLFQQSNTNKKELDQQAIRNMELIKGNFQVTFQAFINQKEQEERKRNLLKHCYKEENGIWTKLENCDYLRFDQFDSLNVRDITFWQNKFKKSSGLILNFPQNSRDTIYINQLFSKIKKQEFFESVFLVDSVNSIIYPNSEIGKKLPLFGKEFKEVYHLPINKEKIIYNDEDHLIYYTPVVIDKFAFYMVGVIKTNTFESAGMRVDFSNLTILVFLLGLMLFSLPILSFLGLTKGDKLTRFGVFSVGLSLVGIMVILGFGFSFSKNHHPLSDQDHEVAMHEIRKSIQAKLFDKTSLLNNWNTDATKLLPQVNVRPANDLIRINKLGGIESIYQNGKLDTLNQIYRSLQHRIYYSYFLKPSEKNEIKEFNKTKSDINYIGSHYSLANSKQESVISRYDSALNLVEAITFSWDTKLTQYDTLREYLFFKKNGLIINKSERIKVAADSLSQLLSAKKWQEVEAIINNNLSSDQDLQWMIPLYLDGHAFNGYLQKVSLENHHFDQDLWMLYLKDEHLEHVYSSLVTFETTILLLFYLLMLALISLANKLNKTKTKNKTIEKFAYNYLYPKKSKAKNFEYLIWFMVIYIFLIIYFYHLPDINFFGIFAILIITTFHFKVITYMMLGPSWQKSNSQLSAEENRKIIKNSRNQEISRFIWIMGLVIAISFGFLAGLIPYISYFILFIWVIGSSYYTFKKRLKISEKNEIKIKPKDETSRESQGSQNSLATNFHYTYTSFFIMWIFMIGFVPGYIIYSKVHQFESKNWEPQKKAENYKDIPDIFWNTYDEGRRLFFGNLTDQNASQVKAFIYTDRSLMQPKLAHFKLIDPATLFKPIQKLKESMLLFISVTIAFLLILALFIWMVYTLTKKIYFLDFEGFLYHHQNPNTSTLNQKVFLCGIDSENYPKWIQNLIDLGNHEITDCTSNPDLKWGESITPDLGAKNIWIIKNVHCLPDPLLLLERLPHFIKAVNENIYLVFSSGFSWKQLLYQIKDPHQKMVFSELFSSFHFEYIPIELDPYLKVKTPNDEKASILIRSRKAYFYNIWSEMSFEEKKICYYFSQEGFFNFTNKPVITELIQKGILVPRGILDGGESSELFPILFDKHFRIFILNNVTEEEIQAFKRDEEKNGNASSIQIAVFSFILLSVALISYFDKNFLDQASTFVAGITGALGGIYSLIRNSLPSLGKSKS
ncbi:hypothetical protein SAMN00777080_1242 [Aquiflexum balticum DSM 16537]|uniref:Uncharacterized protein n=1 Tax=Aquiflexum balticum DSM 16537 TaxID=758820 RepID=A0A1W2H166_9BACT|nr:hypothetical protein [Aquiflexum balticum]SMD42680.1 hypothetical protein SAMN00777080_1242 [Aquiflexum balticum DSM 16537]